jgi:hypothetical protein
MRKFLAPLLFSLTCFLPTASLEAAGPPTPRAATPAPSTLAPPTAAETSKASASAAKAPPSKASIGDTELERSIRARFARSKISTNGFTVKVQGGLAILEGKTSIIQHKGTATRLAKSAGAKQVDNRIEISEAARAKATAKLAAGRKVHVKATGSN